MPSSITLTVAHLPTSTSFFLSALQPLHYCYRGVTEQTVGFGPKTPPDTPPDFWITQEIPGVPAGAAYVAFPASSPKAVEDFFVAALRAGGKIHGEPQVRDASGYFSAAVIDFDGNSIEAVYRPSLNGKSQAAARTTVSKNSIVSKPPASIVPRSSISQSPRSVAVVSETQPRSVVTPAAPSQAPTQTRRSSKGDVLDNLLDTAQGATNIARQVLSHATSTSPASATNTAANNSSRSGDAVACTLLGIAAGAALHYAFSNRDKDKIEDKDKIPQLRRSSTLPPEAIQPMEYYEPSSYHSRHDRHHPTMPYRTITAPASAPTGQRYITLYEYDNDSGYSSRRNSGSKKVYADDRSYTSSRRGSGDRYRVIESPPPTSYRAPSVRTAAETAMSYRDSDRRSSRRGSESSSRSDSRPLSRSGSTASRKPEYVYSREIRDEESPRALVQITEVIRKVAASPESLSRSNSRTSTIRPSPRENDRKTTTSRTTYTTAKDRESSTTKTKRVYRTASPSRPSSTRSHASRAQTAPLLVEANLISLNGDGTLETRGEEGNGDMKARTGSVVGKSRDLRRLGVKSSDVRPCDSVSQC